MARRRQNKGIFATISQMQVDAARVRTAQANAQMAAMRANMAAQTQARMEAEQAQRAYALARQAEEQERRRLYVEWQTANVNYRNEQLQQTVLQLQNILRDSLATTLYIDLDSLKRYDPIPEFDAGPIAYPMPPPRWEQFCPSEPTGIGRLRSNAKERHAQAVAYAHQQFQTALAAYERAEGQRQEDLATAWNIYQRHVSETRSAMDAQHAEIERFKGNLAAGDDKAIIEYMEMLLALSPYPGGFPTQAQVGYSASRKQLIIERDLPPLGIVPEIAGLQYIAALDQVSETRRWPHEIDALYRLIIAQVVLRTLHEALQADLWGHVGSIAFNGYVTVLNIATGNNERRCVVSLTVSRNDFSGINLAMVHPLACIERLHTSMSSNLAEGIAISPFVRLQGDDPFASESDSSQESGIAPRLNLLMLTPLQFEELIAALFQSMGLETELTKASHDGGIDCIAYDRRPVIGGELIIQVKRYSKTVGVSVVRDLYGAMQDRRASKGILVTTSGYGNDSYKFVEGKPLELIDGKALIALLSKHMGLEATIDMTTINSPVFAL